MNNNHIKFEDCWIPTEWKNKVCVLDDVFPKTYFNQISSYVNSTKMPWRFLNNISAGDDFHDSTDNYNFGHTSNILSNITLDKEGKEILTTAAPSKVGLLPSTFISFLTPLLYFIQDLIGINFLIRARFDMTTRTPIQEGYPHTSHVDFNNPHIACIVYMNDSDGDTIIFNETEKKQNDTLTIKEKVSPKRGRIILFDGKFIHTGCSPYKNKNRILLNSNFTNTP
jgi:hypothetical protein